MTHTVSHRAPRTPHGATRVAVVLGALVLVLLGGTGLLVGCQSAPAPAPVASPVTGTAKPTVAALTPAAPLRVSVPSIGAESSLVPTGLKNDRSLAVPPLDQPGQASWYTGSPTPGATGPAVVLGHINGNGVPGVFARLGELRPGALVLVDRADGMRATFTVAATETAPKAAFPKDRVFADTAGSEIRLISCGGDLDVSRHSYEENIIAYASLTSVSRIAG